MNYSAEITIRKDADMIYAVLEPEIKGSDFSRAKISLKKDDCARITIEAKDSIAFRAMLGTVTKTLMLYEKAVKND